MATGNNSAMYLEALKAIKLQGEQAPVGSDARLLYQTKANSLRETLKKMGYANVDADYGAGVSLANTPGGGKIDWNVLTNAADILGTSQAGSTRSAFDRALGEYLTRNLPVWQKTSASPSAAVTSTASSVMGGGGAAARIISGGTITPTGSSTSIGVGGTNTGVGSTTGTIAGQPSRTTAGRVPGVGEVAQTPVSTMGAVAPTGTGAGMGSGAGLYGDFIQSAYFKNNDFDGYFLSVNKGLNLPTLTDPTTGKVTIDWANKTTPISSSVFNSYGNMTKLWNTLQGLSKEKDTFNSIDIENNPVFKEQLNVLDAEMQSLQKQFNLNVDAQLAGLKGSIDVNKAGLEYELNTIRREISASNWRSRQSLAASGMAFSGMLGYLYGQNEAKGTDAAIKATSISAAEIKAIGNQMAILDGSKLSYASDLERLYGAKRALARATILDPQNARLGEIGQLIDQGIADFETEKGTVAPAAELTARGEAAATATANYDTAVELAKLDKQGIWLKQDAQGNWTWQTGLTDAEQTTRDSALFDQWYKTEGLNLDWANLDLNKDKLVLDQAKQKFAEWATTQGLNLDAAKLDLEWAKLVETVRSDKAGEAGKTGTTNPDGTPAYDQKPDLSVLSNSGASPAALGLANTRLMAGNGSVSGDTLGEFMDGVTLYWDPTTKAWTTTSPQGVANPIVSKGNPGFLALSENEMYNTLDLISDPVMAGVSWALWAVKNNPGTGYEQTIDLWATNNKWKDAQKTSALSILNRYQSSIGAP